METWGRSLYDESIDVAWYYLMHMSPIFAFSISLSFLL